MSKEFSSDEKNRCNLVLKTKTWKKLDVTDDNKVTEYSADHIIIATGARSRELPNLPQDGEK
jgi:dihydrolipoamide dehydrogenase